jgi:hypothetical protein
MAFDFVRSAMAVACLVTVSCGPSSSRRQNNQPPFGFVDLPKEGETVGRVVDVVGWAIDDSAVASIDVYVDGQFRASTRLRDPRPDVTAAFARYPRHDNLHGWHTEVELGEAPGPHRILIRATDDEGMTRDLGVLTVQLIGRD